MLKNPSSPKNIKISKMLSGLLLTCFLLTTLTFTPSWGINDTSEITALVKLSAGYHVSIGVSFVPGDLLIIQTPRGSNYLVSNLTIGTSLQKKCNFNLTYESDDAHGKINSIALFPNYKVVMDWSEVKLSRRPVDDMWSEVKFARTNLGKISIFDLNTCTNVKNMLFSIDVMHSRKFFKTLFYEDGFDAIFANNVTGTRQSFDIDGEKIDEKNFRGGPILGANYAPIDIAPASTKSRSAGFFMITDNYYKPMKKQLSFVDANGVVIKQLLKNIETSQYSIYNNQSSYAICWENREQFSDGDKIIRCARFDGEHGKQIMAGNEQRYKEQSPKATRTLKGGGILLFMTTALRYGYEGELKMIMMLPGCQTNKIFKYPMPDLKFITHIDVNEEDGILEIIYESSGYLQGYLKAQKFDLPDAKC